MKASDTAAAHGALPDGGMSLIHRRIGRGVAEPDRLVRDGTTRSSGACRRVRPKGATSRGLRGWRVLLGLLISCAAVVVAGSPVGAATPADVVLTAHLTRGCPEPDSCTFTASGAIVDTGTVTSELIHAAALSSPVTGTAQYIRTFHGQHGTLTVLLQTRLSATEVPWQFHEDGRWTTLDATGAYAGLLGQGTESGTRDFVEQTLDAIYTGQLQLPAGA